MAFYNFCDWRHGGHSSPFLADLAPRYPRYQEWKPRTTQGLGLVFLLLASSQREVALTETGNPFTVSVCARGGRSTQNSTIK